MTPETIYMICGSLFTLSALVMLAAVARFRTLVRERRTRVVPHSIALMLEHEELSRMGM